MNIVPALAAAFNGTPIVWHYNDDMPALLKKVFRPLTAILADKIIIQGKKIGEQYLKHNTKFWNKMAFVYPGVDTNEFNADIFGSREKKRVRAEFDVPQGYYLVGTIGNINSFKGHSYFIKAANKIKDEIKDVKFLIVGSKLDTASAYWNKLQKLVSELGLEDDVIFTGFRSDIPEILSALDVFVLSSVREACPNVVLEAMAMRVPVVATDVGAVSEQVINGQTGILVQARNPTAIANAVLAYLRKPKEEIEEMLSKAQKRIDSTFSLSKITEQQKKIYEALLDSTKFE
jgi:glycosyltransferase involved in cell wall biosynthesis